jgi:hypothetical protein
MRYVVGKRFKDRRSAIASHLTGTSMGLIYKESPILPYGKGITSRSDKRLAATNRSFEYNIQQLAC